MGDAARGRQSPVCWAPQMSSGRLPGGGGCLMVLDGSADYLQAHHRLHQIPLEKEEGGRLRKPLCLGPHSGAGGEGQPPAPRALPLGAAAPVPTSRPPAGFGLQGNAALAWGGGGGCPSFLLTQFPPDGYSISPIPLPWGQGAW